MTPATYYYQNQASGNSAITPSPDEVTANIESDGDADTFVFRLTKGADYLIGVRAAPSAEGRTLPHATIKHLRWSEDDFVRRRTGAVEESDMTAAGQISTGEFLLHLTAPETAYYMLTVKGRSGETGAYSVIVAEATTSEASGKDLPANIWTTARLQPGQRSSGTLAVSSDADWFVVKLRADQLYVFSRTGLFPSYDTPIYSRLTILGPTGEALTGQTSYVIDENLRTFHFRPADSGTYYLQKDSTFDNIAGTGTYDIVWAEDEHGSAEAFQTPVTIGEGVTGVLSHRSSLGFAGDDSDWFSVQLEQGKTYRAEAWGIGADGVDVGGTLPDPVIYIDTALRGITEASGAGRNHILKIPPQTPGRYVLGIDSNRRIYRDHTYTFFVEEAYTEVDLSFGAATYDATGGSGGSVTVTVSLDQAPGREVVIPITVTESADATSSDYSGRTRDSHVLVHRDQQDLHGHVNRGR